MGRALALFALLIACAKAPTAVPSRAWEAQARGCDDIYLVVSDATKKAFLVIETSRAKLNLRATGATATIDLERASGSSVFVESYPREGASFCTDLSIDEPKRTETWPAVRGHVAITLGEIRNEADFDVALTLEGVVVRHPDGALEPIPDASFASVRVGWLPG